MAVVAESSDDRSVVFRTYCRAWPIDEPRRVRHPIPKSGETHPGDVVGRYLAALAAGDADAVVSTFAPDGYFREPIGPGSTHRRHLRTAVVLRRSVSAPAAVSASEHCAVTDDGVRCALEYNCVSWGRYDLPAQAGLGVYERDSEGLLAAARVYHDIEAPLEHP